MPRRSERLRTSWTLPPEMGQYYQSLPTSFCEDSSFLMMLLEDADPRAPTSFRAALSGDAVSQWQDAIDCEISSHIENGTWEEASLPPGREAIGATWAFKLKTDENGNIQRYKARLCAQGFSQVRGVDYLETYAPTSRYSTLRIFITLAIMMSLSIIQMDIKTAFLYGILEEEIYMRPPQGVSVTAGKVLRLRKCIYGLKQAPRVWNENIHKLFTSLGGVNSQFDECLYIFHGDDGEIVLLNLFVDDILLAFKGVKLRDKIVTALKGAYSVVELGTPKYCLGMKFSYVRETIELSQRAAVDRFLKRFNMEDCKSVSTPMDSNFKSRSRIENSNDPEEQLTNAPYRAAIGCLLYLSQCTRPDITHAVAVLARFGANPAERHWIAVKRIFRYLQGTKDYALVFRQPVAVPAPSNALVGFSDSSWGDDLDKRRSSGGYIFQLYGNSITWSSKLQKCIALSSCEAEYVAIASACREGLWMCNLLDSLQLFKDQQIVLHLFGDNQGSLKLGHNQSYHTDTKHIAIKYHFIRDQIKSGRVITQWIPTDQMVADCFTKPLPLPKLSRLIPFLNLANSLLDH